MTRLFIRFYLGVIAILIAAWLIQSYLVRERSATQNLRVVEQALSGGARLARDELASASPRNADEAMQRIQARFEYPVNRFPLDVDWLTPAWKERLLKDEVVLFGDRIAIALPSQSSRRILRSQANPRFPANSCRAHLTKTPRRAHRVRRCCWGHCLSSLAPVKPKSPSDMASFFSWRRLPLPSCFARWCHKCEPWNERPQRLLKGISRPESTAPKHPKTWRSFALSTRWPIEPRHSSVRSGNYCRLSRTNLRTPLARIRFAADLVESAKTDQERRTRLDAIDSATQKLDDLVGELLTYVRMDFQASNGPAETIDLHHLFSELIDIHAPLNPSIRFHDAGAGDPIRITTDRDGLARAIENLLSNAAKHAKREVCLQASVAGDQVLLFVDDDGEGVPIENRQKIFEPFVRLKDSQEPGTGLGLALVQRIVRRLSGEVDVGDSPLGGARFTVRLPRQAP